MKLAELEKRLIELEKEVENLKVASRGSVVEPWFKTALGRHANDPVFEEIVRLGKEYRESLHPDHKKNTKKRKPS